MFSFRFLVVAMLALMVFAAGCGDDSTVAGDEPLPSDPAPDPTEPPPSDPCDEGEWITVDNGQFTLRLPADLVDQEPQGIDSLVGDHRRDDMQVQYDYGWYSPNFDDLVARGATEESLTLDGLDATLVIAGPELEPVGSARHFTGLHVVTDTGEVSDTVQGPSTALALWVTHDEADDAPVARCIAESVDFA